MASPLEGIKRLMGTRTFYPSRNRVSYDLSLLNGNDEAASIRGDEKQAKKVPFAVPFGDAHLCRKDAGESGKAFAR